LKTSKETVAGGLRPNLDTPPADAQADGAACNHAAMALMNLQAEVALAAMGEGVVLQDRESVILRHNPAAARVLGLSEDHLTGRASTDPRWSLLREDGSPLPLEEQPSMICLRTGAPVDGQIVRVQLPQGGERWLSVNSRPIFEPGSDAPSQTVTTFADITELRAQAARLEAALEEARAANQAKSDFLATVSHEIRTPLNGVISMSGLLARNALTARQREIAEVLVSSGRSLERILDDLLDLSKVEAGRLELEHQPFDLAAELHVLGEIFRAKAEDKGVAYGEDVTDIAGRRFVGDPLRIKQIVSNLLSNAVKFTHAGSVSLRARIGGAPDAAGRHPVILEVRDTGIGVEPDAVDDVFQPYRQADASIARRFGGTGLGLSICRALAELMDGEVTVNSEVGVGSVFRLELPLAAAPPEAAGRPASEDDADGFDLSGLQILVADDHPMNRKVVALMLEGAGAKLAMVEDADTAVRTFGAGAFDVVLMDMHMPGRDGLSAVRDIRRMEAERAAAPSYVVMMTGTSGDDWRSQAVAAGADDVLAKPVTPEAFFDQMAAALEARAARRTAAGRPRTRSA